ncbi:hypothetical protein ACFFK0_25830 [Paenibacillus chartarius]|uniref:Uncharacterized protein n=1 Tax=Paenibacillus chartarius TaxID=747481 RepID=A0ABV6DT18_9BACL
MSMASRKQEIVRRIALLAHEQPVLGSGLWFHTDVRNNFYYASYLFAAAANPDLQLSFDRTEAQAKACRIFTELLELQDRDPHSGTYGHWPLHLHPVPREAEPNSLPVELMGSLLMYFFHRYGAGLPERLRASMRQALEHVYRSGFFRKPLRDYNHHEAKYTAAKLLFGQWFGDEELLQDGWQSLKSTLLHVQTKGMPEYGCLPWFWHWVQAFTCALEMVRQEEIAADLRAMLDYLWTERSLYYVKGAWAGPHSRGLSHDIPKDANVLFDYVQYGDFELPHELPRVEYAGFLSYEAPAQAKAAALDRSVPAEVKRVVTKQTDSGEVRLNTYAYMTQHYAVGGVLERFREYDNEQHRWDVTFPLVNHDSVNQLFFFQPGDHYSAGDPRHQSDGGDIALNRNVSIALYPAAHGSGERMVGILPKGDWRMEERSLYGFINDEVYAAVFLLLPYAAEQLDDRITITGENGSNAVVVEVISTEEAGAIGIGSFDSFVAAMRGKRPQFEDAAKGFIRYTSLLGNQVALSVEI